MPLRIVLLLLEPPLPDGKAVSRWYYVLLRKLVEKGHSVKCFCACSRPEDIDRTKELFTDPKFQMKYYLFPRKNTLVSKMQTVLRPKSFQFSSDLIRDIHLEMEDGADVLHVEQLWSGWVARPYRDRTLVNIHHLQNIDLAGEKGSTLKERVNFNLALKTEKKLVRDFLHVRCSSPKLVPYVNRWNPKARVNTIPIGIDTDLYDFIQDEERSNEKVVSLIGNMNWQTSLSAAKRLLEHIWPKISNSVPDARLQIVGWSARQELQKYLDRENIDIIENVEDLRPYYKNSSLVLYTPTKGSGMKTKVLEAMAYETPIVTTGEGIEGIPAVDGVHGGFAESDELLAARAINLLGDLALQKQYRNNAKQLLIKHCHPQSTVDQIEELYARITHKS